MDEERQQLTNQIIEGQKMMFQAMQGVQMPEWIGNDLTMPQIKILFLLFTFGKMRMSEVANKLGKKVSTATGIVDQLVEQQFIKREESPEDRRVVIIGLTERGTQLCDSFLQAGWEQSQPMLNRLSLEELRIVELAMGLISKAAIAEAQERMNVKE